MKAIGEYIEPCPKGCRNHKFHCGLCDTAVSYSPANYSSRLEDIPNSCQNCDTSRRLRSMIQAYEKGMEQV